MSYTKSIKYPGWICDDTFEDYISPKGRIAIKPGAPFSGQVSEEELAVIKKLAEDTEESVFVDKIKETNVATFAGQEVELVKTIKVGDITINIYRG